MARNRLRSAFLLYLSGFLVYRCSQDLLLEHQRLTDHATKYGSIEFSLLLLICLPISLLTSEGDSVFSSSLLSFPFRACARFLAFLTIAGRHLAYHGLEELC